MSPAMRALLQHILDYAGLFPPAQLPMDQALSNFLQYQKEPENWLLGRFVCPASRLSEITSLRPELKSSLVVAALGRGGQDAKQFLENVRADLADIALFRESMGSRVEVDVYEVRWPPTLFDPPRLNQLHALVGTAAFFIETSGPPALTPFYEPPSPGREHLQTAVEILLADRHALEASKRQRCRPAGLKLRCGGVQKDNFPSAEQAATALDLCRRSRLPLKFTAGLHHPFPGLDTTLQARRHGFINIFLAGMLARKFDWNEKQIQEILEDDKPENFSAKEDAIAWNSLLVASEEIKAARKDLVLSFGSCSFEEPRDDLRNLGWM